MVTRKRMVGFQTLASVDAAISALRNRLREFRPVSTRVSLSESLGRVVSQDIRSPVDLPSFDRSAVDGFAIKARNVVGATPTNPSLLYVVGRSEPGMDPSALRTLREGQAMEILTGGPLPPDADSIVMVEYAKREGAEVSIYRPIAPFGNVSRRGEDFSKGEVIATKGSKVKPWHIGAFASVNIVKVPVWRRLRIAILSTGREVREPGEEIRPGEVVNSSRPMLEALVVDRGCEPLTLNTVVDDIYKIKDSLGRALKMADIVITTGGTSLGEKDVIPEAVNALGKPGVIVHGVAMRPGKPVGIGFLGGKPVFMLSGYPVASLVGFETFVDEAIHFIYGSPREPEPQIKAKLTRKIATPVGFRSFVRVRLFHKNGCYFAEPLRLTGSGILSTMTRANGILVVPENLEGYDEGNEVTIRLVQPIKGVST